MMVFERDVCLLRQALRDISVVGNALRVRMRLLRVCAEDGQRGRVCAFVSTTDVESRLYAQQKGEVGAGRVVGDVLWGVDNEGIDRVLWMEMVF